MSRIWQYNRKPREIHRLSLMNSFQLTDFVIKRTVTQENLWNCCVAFILLLLFDCQKVVHYIGNRVQFGTQPNPCFHSRNVFPMNHSHPELLTCSRRNGLCFALRFAALPLLKKSVSYLRADCFLHIISMFPWMTLFDSSFSVCFELRSLTILIYDKSSLSFVAVAQVQWMGFRFPFCSVHLFSICLRGRRWVQRDTVSYCWSSFQWLEDY